MIQRPTERSAILTQADGQSWSFTTRLDYTPESHWVLEDIPGWYGGSGVRSTVTDRYRHGDFPSRGWREGRTLSIRGAVRNIDPDTRDDVERELSGILWDGQEGTLAVQEADDRVLWTTVRLDGTPSVEKLDEKILQFSIPLRSAEPFVYGPWREGTLTLPGAGVGLEYPLFSGGGMLGPELLPAGNFETGTVEDLFPTSASTHLGMWDLVQDGTAATGRRFGRVARNDFVGNVSFPNVRVTPGKTYRVSVTARVNGGPITSSPSIGWPMNWYTADGTLYNGAYPNGVYRNDRFTSKLTDEWQTFTDDVVVPDGMAEINPRFVRNTGQEPPDATFDFDNVSIREVIPVLTFGAAIDTEVTMWNNGNARSYPQIEVVGDLPGGFAVTVGSRRVTYPWPTFPDMPVLVDMSGSLSVSGQDQSHRLVERNWSGIEPGTAETPKLDPLQGGTGWAVVRHRDTYI